MVLDEDLDATAILPRIAPSRAANARPVRGRTLPDWPARRALRAKRRLRSSLPPRRAPSGCLSGRRPAACRRPPHGSPHAFPRYPTGQARARSGHGDIDPRRLGRRRDFVALRLAGFLAVGPVVDDHRHALLVRPGNVLGGDLPGNQGVIVKPLVRRSFLLDLGQRFEGRLAMAFELCRADPFDGGKLPERCWLDRADFAQRPVMENHVGRHACPLARSRRSRAAPRKWVVRQVGPARARAARSLGRDDDTTSPRPSGSPWRRAEAQPAIFVGAKRIACHQRARDRLDERQSSASTIPNTDRRRCPNWRTFSLSPPASTSEMPDAEPLFGPIRRRQQFARDLGHIGRPRRLEAIVAIAAGLRRVLAEMPQQHRAAAPGGFHHPCERVEPVALCAAAIGPTSVSIRWRAREKSSAPQNINACAGSPSRPRGESPYRPRSTWARRRGRRSGLGLIDPHAEGDRRESRCRRCRGTLPGFATRRGSIPAWYGSARGQAASCWPVRRVAARRIHDAWPRLAGRQRFDPLEAQLRGRTRYRMLSRRNPGIISPLGFSSWRSCGAGVGCRRWRLARAAGTGADEQRPQQAVVRPEIMAPLGHAVRLVDRDQGHGSASSAEAPPRTLRRDVQEVELPPRSASRMSRGRALVGGRRVPKPCEQLRTWSSISAISGQMTSAVPLDDAGSW